MKFKNIYIIAGPNGSGKTTFALKFLPKYVKCQNFINADLIAQGISPFSPQHVALQAGRIVLHQIQEYSRKGVDFGFETTLSGKSYEKTLKTLKANGYKLNLFLLWVPSAKLSMRRIKDRVSEGGHNVPSNDVKRRFGRSISNTFKIYLPLMESWMIFDNSGIKPKLIARFQNGVKTILVQELYSKILKGASGL